jgi:hypothetical protein
MAIVPQMSATPKNSTAKKTAPSCLSDHLEQIYPSEDEERQCE